MTIVYYYAEFNKIFYDNLPDNWELLSPDDKYYFITTAFDEFVSLSEDRDAYFLDWLNSGEGDEEDLTASQQW